MLPHNHFLVAGLAISPVAVAFYPEKSAAEIIGWVIIGGLLSAAIDLDIFILVLLKSKGEKRLKQFMNPLEIYRKFDLFMDTIAETGVLKTGLKTHVIFPSVILLLCCLFLSRYFMPVALGVLTHILSDLPNLRKAGI